MEVVKKKYRCIAKIANKDFVKYNVNDLIQFAAFLDKSFPEWRWFNVYEYVKGAQGKQLKSFSKANRPDHRDGKLNCVR